MLFDALTIWKFRPSTTTKKWLKTNSEIKVQN